MRFSRNTHTPKIYVGWLFSLLWLVSCQVPVASPKIPPLAPPVAKVEAKVPVAPPTAKIKLQGRILVPTTFSTKALTPAQIVAQATVSIIDPVTHKVLETTLSNGQGEFSFAELALADQAYFIDIHKREQALGKSALFLRTLIRLQAGQLESITQNGIIISPQTTAVAMAGLLNQMANYQALLNTVSADGLTLQGDITPEVTMAKVDKLKAMVDNQIGGEGDPLKMKPVIVTSINKTSTLAGDVLVIDGLGITDTTVAKLNTQTMEEVTHLPYQLQVRVPAGANTGNIVLENSVAQSEPIAVKVASKIQVVGGNFQVQISGNTLFQPMRIKVLDASDQPVNNIPVQVAFTGGSGTLASDALVTDANGDATVTSSVAHVGFNDVQFQLGTTTTATTFRHVGVTSLDKHIFWLTENLELPARSFQPGSHLKVKVVKNDFSPYAGATVSFNSFPEYLPNLYDSPRFAIFDAWFIHMARTATTDANGVAESPDNFYTPYLACSNCSFAAGLSVPDLLGETIVMTPNYTAPAADKIVSSLQISSGNNQSAEAGRDFANDLIVEARDQNNQLLNGVPVVLSVTEGSAQYMANNPADFPVRYTTGFYNPNGKVQFKVRAPLSPQTVKIKAEVANGEGTPVTFVENVIQSSTNMLLLDTPGGSSLYPGESTNGTANKADFKVKLLDPNQNPVAGASIQFSLDFSIYYFCTAATLTDINDNETGNPINVVTDANGIATARLNTPTFLNGCGYSHINTQGPPGTFGTPGSNFYSVFNGPPTQIQIDSGDGQTNIPIGNFSAPLKFKTFDAYNNPDVANYMHQTKVRFELVQGSGLLNGQAGPIEVDAATGTGVNFIPTSAGAIQVRATLLNGGQPAIDFHLTAINT